MHDHQRLLAWQEARRLVVEIYDLTRGFPNDERFGLTSQLRRAAVSIPSNIAEGAGHSTDGTFVRYLRIAAGSASEVETQLQIAVDVSFTTQADVATAMDRVQGVRRMLWGLQEHLIRDRQPAPRV